jgi:TetR/AcrR family transcriptional regulator, cholesterol catabolism regulator
VTRQEGTGDVAANGQAEMEAAPAAIPDKATLPRNQARRRARIVDEAYNLVMEGDEANVEIRDISDRAGVSLATTYRYFGSKDRLMAEVYEQWFTGNINGFERGLQEVSSPHERLPFAALRLLDMFVGAPPLFRVITQAMRITRDPSVTEIRERCQGKFLELIHQSLAGVPGDDVESMALIMVSVVLFWMDRHLWEDIPIDEARHQVSVAARIVLKSVS